MAGRLKGCVMFLRPIILAALLVTSAPGIAQSGGTTGLLRADDYPSEALRLGQQGTVRVRLKVSAGGRVTGCNILQSAGPSLDRATCKILQERARFKPATSISGEAIESEFDAPPIHWRLPGTPLPPLRTGS